jgi:hypothetical protein
MYYKLILDEKCGLGRIYCEKIRFQKDNVIFEKCIDLNVYNGWSNIYGENVSLTKKYRIDITDKIILNRDCYLGKIEINEDMPPITYEDCKNEYDKMYKEVEKKARQEIINHMPEPPITPPMRVVVEGVGNGKLIDDKIVLNKKQSIWDKFIGFFWGRE